MSQLDAVRRAQWAAAQAGSHTVEVGPMLATFDGVSTHPNRNYAVAGPTMPTPADVAALISLYRSRGLLPRMELLDPAPELLTALLAGGFTIGDRLPIMVLDVLQPRLADGFTVLAARERADVERCAAVQNASYGDPPATAVDADRLAHLVSQGGTVALAVAADGTAAGSGLATPVRHGVATIAAVGTLPAYRRHGVAGAVASMLTQAVLAAGGVPWLETEAENEQRLYGSIGYRTFGEEVVVVAP